MSMRALPVVVVSLGGEMLYILDQRLAAQNTSRDNSEKVLKDIVGTMFSQAFMDELLKPQQMYSHRTMKVVLTRLAHVSIMRLNPVSMEKLYELMIMAFKYQVLLCPRPKDLLLITYNHMDAIRGFVKGTPVLLNKLDQTHRRIIEIYSTMTAGQFQILRQTLLAFLQDTHVRVAMFLKNLIQNPDGRFALSASGPTPHGVDLPGSIRIFDTKGRKVREVHFPSGGSYSAANKEGSFGLHGDRVLRLGMNIYTVNLAVEPSKSPSLKTDNLTPNLLAKEELNLLARLMGKVEMDNMSAGESGFHINLFGAGQEDDTGAAGGTEDSSGVISIQALKDEYSATQLSQIARLFAEQEATSEKVNSSKGDNLLAMMDDL
ncbi:protein OSCP1a isoform X2 [Nerophis ophidion]|uniref:protein OSCP1a isoform X2 n=1 Tax=Nerophis ophidion TaxID=159077 RepID=UPI002ADFA62D|nr:protein OSCP1a isoform X2 [Nerophis ophidion]